MGELLFSLSGFRFTESLLSFLITEGVGDEVFYGEHVVERIRSASSVAGVQMSFLVLLQATIRLLAHLPGKVPKDTKAILFIELFNARKSIPTLVSTCSLGGIW